MSAPLSAIHSVESSRYSKDILQSKQLTSMLLTEGVDTDPNYRKGEIINTINLNTSQLQELV
jgi:hypothetical protein